MSVVDIGAGADPDPRAGVTLDRVDLDTIDVVHDLEERPWPLADDEYDTIIARHVLEHLEHPEEAFAEAARILVDGGVFEVHVPLGLDAQTDPTHVDEWTWDTPEYFTTNPPYDYGWELPFNITERDLEWWLDGPFGLFERVVDRWLRHHGAGKWLSGVPGLSGVMTVTYRRCPR